MKKMNLEELRVRSFVTKQQHDFSATVRGGVTVNGPVCSIQYCESDQVCDPGTRQCNTNDTVDAQCAASLPAGCTFNGCTLTCGQIDTGVCSGIC